jgi:hypothetical protein
MSITQIKVIEIRIALLDLVSRREKHSPEELSRSYGSYVVLSCVGVLVPIYIFVYKSKVNVQVREISFYSFTIDL